MYLATFHYCPTSKLSKPDLLMKAINCSFNLNKSWHVALELKD